MPPAEQPTAMRRYTIEALIGEGAYGKVYRATEHGGSGFQTQVALKMLHPIKESEGDTLQRTRDEARLLGLLRHDAIVRVNALAYIAGRWTMVMDHLVGLDLHQIIRLNGDDRPPPSVALAVLSQVAGALHYAHSVATNNKDKPLGLLHRDLKPSNLMLTDTGKVKILDFGTARADFEGREADTRQIQLGTMLYMAPEHLWSNVTGPAMDIYSLGATVYELLCGQRFGRARPSPETYLPHRDAKLEILRGLLGHQGWDLLTLLSEMLAFDPQERPSAAQVGRRATELLATMRDEPTLEQWAGRVVPLLLLSRRDRPDDDLVGGTFSELPPPSTPQGVEPTLEHPAQPPRPPTPTPTPPPHQPATAETSEAKSLTTPPPPAVDPGEPPPPPGAAAAPGEPEGDEDPEAATDPGLLQAAQQASIEDATTPTDAPEPATEAATESETEPPSGPPALPRPTPSAAPARPRRAWLLLPVLAGLAVLGFAVWRAVPHSPADLTPPKDDRIPTIAPPDPDQPDEHDGAEHPSATSVDDDEPARPAEGDDRGAGTEGPPVDAPEARNPGPEPQATVPPPPEDEGAPGSASDQAPAVQEEDHAAAGAAGSVCSVTVLGLEGAYLEEPGGRVFALPAKVPAGPWVLNGAFQGGTVNAIRSYTIQGDWSTAVFDCTGEARQRAATCGLTGSP